MCAAQPEKEKKLVREKPAAQAQRRLGVHSAGNQTAQDIDGDGAREQA
jgi:hypothetical protein